jgi:hypothetical protein
MRHAHLICKASPHIFTEVIEAFKIEFINNGWKFTYENAFKRDEKMPFSDRLNIVIKAQREFSPDRLPEGSFKVLFQSEQFSKLRQFNSTPHAENWDLILDVFRSNAGHFDEPLDNTIFFPIGYHKAYTWENYSKKIFDRPAVFDMDCYSFGARTSYRMDIWRECVSPLSNNIRFGNTDLETLKYYYIMASKVNLFIDGWSPYQLPMMHCMQVLANGKMLIVITEDIHRDYSPYQSGQHFIQAHPSVAKKVIKKFLDDEDMREEFAEKMFDNIIKYHKFSHYMKEFFHRIPNG